MFAEPLEFPADRGAVPADPTGHLGIGEPSHFRVIDAETIVERKMGIRHRQPGLSGFSLGKPNLPKPGGDVLHRGIFVAL